MDNFLKFLNSHGYAFDDKDPLWMDGYVSEHRWGDIYMLFIAYSDFECLREENVCKNCTAYHSNGYCGVLKINIVNELFYCADFLHRDRVK